MGNPMNDSRDPLDLKFRRNDGPHEATNPGRLRREVVAARARVVRSAAELYDRVSSGKFGVPGPAHEHGGEIRRKLRARAKSMPENSWMMMSFGLNGAAHAYDACDNEIREKRSG